MSSNTLLGSAKQFLVEALDNYRERKTAFAILHAVTATELVLKERLSRVNPALIFRNIDAPQVTKGPTVALGSIPQRLANLGSPLTPGEVMLINTFVEWRNQIVHHIPAFDPQVGARQLPQLLDTLALFLRRDLSTSLESFLPRELYRVVMGVLGDWEGVVRRAKTTAEAEGSVLADPCPDCGASQVLSLRDERRVYCHLCQVGQYRYDRCDKCGRLTISSFSAFDTGNWCDTCLDAAGDQYIQMQIDIERGK